MPPSLQEKKRLIRTIERLLRQTYGRPQKNLHNDPLDVLIQTILSQNTSDRNSRRAFESLRLRFKTWDEALAAEGSQLEEAIRSGGLAKVKAQRIQDILRDIRNTWGKLSLQFLCAMETQQAAALLSRFKGVGPKTVHCVLLFGCARDVFPVDTHILRISKRLGLLDKTVILGRAHGLWAQFIPPRLAFSLHLNLIEHGRRACRSRSPLCSECCLRELCGYARTIP